MLQLLVLVLYLRALLLDEHAPPPALALAPRRDFVLARHMHAFHIPARAGIE
jgi:hypothetical protein